MEVVGIGVLVTVISALILGAGRWLFAEENRNKLRQSVKQGRCRHSWEPLPEELISPDSEWCTNCGARR